jgi:hypothetical protein
VREERDQEEEGRAEQTINSVTPSLVRLLLLLLLLLVPVLLPLFSLLQPLL